ncbi:magnesium chelatase domain-containing protein [Niallia oryzisoli]|uniref:Magnesium chelatase domain-containing protein n=1 Tax=Niallia oryzisoli TaxID=1737571 RepID=A0ABZ2CFD7_9BACI
MNARTDKELFVIVGLPDASVKELIERVWSALFERNADIHDKKITVNLSPPEFKKTGPGYDAAMVIAILKSIGELSVEIQEDQCIIGAISLNGELQPFEGMIPVITNAMKLRFKQIYIPPIDTNLFPTTLETELIPTSSISALISHLQGQMTLEIPLTPVIELREDQQLKKEELSQIDFQDIIGHAEAKRALKLLR